jgi:DNA-binding NarL/FixJ family response regulator
LSTGLEGEQSTPPRLDFERQAIARQWLAADDVPQIERKPFEGRETAGFDVEVPEFEPPPCPLAATMLADQPVEPAIEATRQIIALAIDPPPAVVVITTFDLDEYVHAALKAGAKGFLLKDAGPDMLLQAITAAAAGDALIAPSVTARLLDAFADQITSPPPDPIDPLTVREEEVLVAVARGRTNAEIADGLHISLSTVKSHVASLMTKLGARNRVEIAMWAYETGRIAT